MAGSFNSAYRSLEAARTRYTQLARLLASNGTGTTLGFIAQLVAIPIQLNSIGIESYGLLALFLSIVAAGSILDAGIGPTTLRFISRSSGRPKLVEHIMASGITVILAIGCILLVISQIVSFLIPTSIENAQISGLAVPVLADLALLGMILGMLVSLGLNALRGLRLYTAFAVCESSYKLLVPIVMTAIAVATGEIKWMLMGYCVVTFIMAVSALLLATSLAGIRLRLTTNLRYFRRRMLPFGTWVWLQAIFGYLGSQADRFVVAAFVSISTLGFYSVAVSLASGIYALAAAAAGFLLPEAASRLHRRDWLISAFERSTFYLSAWSSAGILSFSLLSPILIGIWLGESKAEAVLPFLIPLLWASGSTITSIPATQFMNAMGHARLAATLGVVNNIITLGAIIAAGWSFGVYGVVIARLVSLPLGLISRAIVIRNVFELSRPLGRALAITWPTLSGAIVGISLMAWFLR